MTTIRSPLLEAAAAAWLTALAVLGACGSGSGQDRPRVPVELLRRAQGGGTIKVVVQLRVHDGASTQTIDATKAALLGEIAATDHRLVRELRGLPLVALEASYATLMILDSSARVLRVEEDGLARPEG